jgi:Ion channel
MCWPALACTDVLRGRITTIAPVHPALRLIAIMVAMVSMSMAAHLCEIALSAVTYSLIETTPQGTDNLYFAFVNYTTPGYGDILPVARWRLLRIMTAMYRVLMFGWSTAVISQVLRRIISQNESGSY